MAKIAKAITAGLGAILAALVASTVQAGKAPDAGSVAVAIISGVVAGAATWRVPNAKPAPVQPQV